MGAGLVMMSVRLSPSLPDRERVIQRIDELRGVGVELADRDREAYARVLAALPSRDRQPGAFRDAVDAANRPPLEVTGLGLEIVEAGEGVAESGNPRLRGDVLTGMILAQAATVSAMELVAINTELAQLGDEDLRLAQRRERLGREIVARVRNTG